MGGYMSVSSKEYCGSTFTFVLFYRVFFIFDDDVLDDFDEFFDVVGYDILVDDIIVGYF